ncbi:MAG: DnaD domain protein [Anaerolineales bacterium]|nr:DnaD domain protein [Anaerolineales bacterium]
MSGTTFPGFPEGRLHLTPVPDVFFRELMAAIDDLAEFKLSLYVFYALSKRQGTVRFLTRDQLAIDDRLMQALAPAGANPAAALDDALARAVDRGTLLQATAGEGEAALTLYFLNSERGRAAAGGLASGAWKPALEDLTAQVDLPERPNIYGLYEQNIGPLTPMIAEHLRDAEQTYPARWIEDAMRIAVANNVRKWSYVQAILKDWQTKGRDEREDLRDTEAARRKYIEGDYADFIDH